MINLLLYILLMIEKKLLVIEKKPLTIEKKKTDTRLRAGSRDSQGVFSRSLVYTSNSSFAVF